MSRYYYGDDFKGYIYDYLADMILEKRKLDRLFSWERYAIHYHAEHIAYEFVEDNSAFDSHNEHVHIKWIKGPKELFSLDKENLVYVGKGEAYNPVGGAKEKGFWEEIMQLEEAGVHTHQPDIDEEIENNPLIKTVKKF